MNTLHDQGHKRTSINELLNPVAVAPPQHLDPHPGFTSNQISTIAAAYIPQQHVSQATSYPSPNMHSAGSSFSLRAASWDHASGEAMARRHDLESPQSCRYAPPVPQHAYAEQHFPRPSRSVDEPQTNYGSAVPSWPNSHEALTVSYGHAMLTPTYPDDRTGELRSLPYGGSPQVNPAPTTGPADPISKNYPSPSSAPHAQYETDLSPQAFPAAPANAWQLAERASIRLAARSTLTPTPIALHPGQPGASYYPQILTAIPIMQAPAPLPKRPLEQFEEDTSPKAKKSRAKAKPTSESTGASAASRRGYNAKKRSEAAQIAAQSATTLVPIVPVNEKDSLRSTLTDGVSIPHPSQLVPELQFARCMSNRYRSEEFPRCVSCTRRWAGDTCRFQGIRYFLKDEKRSIVGISFVESQKPDGPSMNFPIQWNAPLKDNYIYRVKRTVAHALLPVLKLEQEHMSKPEVIRRPRESEVRATCDTCMTSIFAGSWMCRLCGREACAECFEQVKDLTIDKPDASEADIAALQARREKHAHINPFFLSCTRRNEHRATDFSPMSRFTNAELCQAVADMEALLSQEDGDPLLDIPEYSLGQLIEANVDSQDPSGESLPQLSASSVPDGTSLPPDLSSFSTGTPPSLLPSPVLPHVPSHPTRYFRDADLSEEVFRHVWIRGEPLVVTGLLHKFQLQWTPEYFKTKYGSQTCLILECQNDTNKRVTVGEFFSWFGNYAGRRDCWKLKDWPPSTDFKTVFPELYDDFSQATPVPNYVRRDGVLNIASHFPSNTVAPDLGPKMYNAMASFEGQGSKGSTRLHMDMADAINIMLYAAPTPDNRSGCAVWDLYRAEDAGKLRKFLRKKFKGQYQNDPIHSQTFYLDPQLRHELYEEYGIRSYRVYQKPGDAVFIPAGCAHQVCNLADCIKVACDFVSPENIDRCEILTREFREQNQSMVWKEDVLQLRTMMWFAWLSCCRQEKEVQTN